MNNFKIKNETHSKSLRQATLYCHHTHTCMHVCTHVHTQTQEHSFTDLHYVKSFVQCVLIECSFSFETQGMDG
jgi:hypothetical protein